MLLRPLIFPDTTSSTSTRSLREKKKAPTVALGLFFHLRASCPDLGVQSRDAVRIASPCSISLRSCRLPQICHSRTCRLRSNLHPWPILFRTAFPYRNTNFPLFRNNWQPLCRPFLSHVGSSPLHLLLPPCRSMHIATSEWRACSAREHLELQSAPTY